MEVKEYLNINDLDGQIVEGTWGGYTLTLTNGKVYKLEDGIRGWFSGLFYVKDGKLEEVPDWNLSPLFKEHFSEILGDVLKNAGVVCLDGKDISTNQILQSVERKWFDKWLR